MDTGTINTALAPLRKEYFEDVKDIAIWAMEQDDVDEAVYEAVDGCEWVIYTYQAQLALLLSEHAQESFEESNESWSAMAMSAMVEDVYDAISRLKEDV